VSNYGALGGGIAKFCIQLIAFLFWAPFIHNKFAKGIHKDWILQSIMPSFLITLLYLFLLEYIDIDFSHYSRLTTFMLLISLGILLLLLNSLTISKVREVILKKINYKKNNLINCERIYVKYKSAILDLYSKKRDL